MVYFPKANETAAMGAANPMTVETHPEINPATG